ncbi:MAG: tol-pal system YbgF family protein [Gemmatimonadota bacterium]
MSRKRLSKKQLKRDRFVEQTFDWAHWGETHRPQLLGAAALLAVLVASVFVYRHMDRNADERAAVQYLTARQSYFAGNWQLAASDLEAFAARFDSSSFADDAQFFLGDALYQGGQYDHAITQLEKLLDEHPDSPFGLNARLLIGAAHQQQGQFARAIAAYEEALEEIDYNAAQVRVREAMARAYGTQDQIEPAAEQYRKIIELVPDAPAADRARRELAELTVEPLAVSGTAPADSGGSGTTQ